MKHYFLDAKDVGDLTVDLLFGARGGARQADAGCSTASSALSAAASRRRKIAGTSDFVVETTASTSADPEVFARDPVNLIRLFHIADRTTSPSIPTR